MWQEVPYVGCSYVSPELWILSIRTWFHVSIVAPRFLENLWTLPWRICYLYPYHTRHRFQNHAEGPHVIISDCVYYRICSPHQKIRHDPISGFNYREISINIDGNTLHKLPHRCLHLITVRRSAQANDSDSCTSGSMSTDTASPAGQAEDNASDGETHLARLETVRQQPHHQTYSMQCSWHSKEAFHLLTIYVGIAVYRP